MVALILAAGYGTRLYPLAEKTPKALLPIRGKPILAHLIQKLERLNPPVREGVLVSNHRYLEEFRRWFATPPGAIPWTILDDGSTSEKDRLGSMGDLAFAIRSWGQSPLGGQSPLEEGEMLVLGSDNLFEDSLADFVAFARERSPAVTLAAYKLPDRSLGSRYGVLTVGSDSRVTAFEEKPPRPQSALVSTAVYFFPRGSARWVLEYVGSERTSDTLGAFIHWLIARAPVAAYPMRGRWFDIGDITSYNQAEEAFRS